MEETIGQKVLAAVVSHQLGICMDRSMKLYVRGRHIDPSWGVVGAELVKYSLISGSKPSAIRVPRKNVRRRSFVTTPACSTEVVKMKFPIGFLELESAGFRFIGRRQCGSCGEHVSSFRSDQGKFLSLVRLAGGSYISHFSTCQAARSKGKRRRSVPGQWRLF